MRRIEALILVMYAIRQSKAAPAHHDSVPQLWRNVDGEFDSQSFLDSERLLQVQKNESWVLPRPNMEEKILPQVIRDQREATRKIENFVQILRSFVNSKQFDVATFENQTETLRQELMMILAIAERLSPTDELANQLRYSSHMFHTMIEMKDKLKKFTSFGTPGFRILYRIHELGMRILTFNNSHGVLDQSPGFTDNLVRARSSLEFWSEKFRMLKGIAPAVRRQFWDQISEIEYSLGVLESTPKENQGW